MANIIPTCCCCFNLRCGTLTIGILLLISHGLQALISIIPLLLDNIDPSAQDSIRAVFCSTLAVSGIWFVLDVLLIRGVSTSQPALLVAWLCWSMPIIFLATVACGFLVKFANEYEDKAYVITASTALAHYLVLWYWALVVLQYCRWMMATRAAPVASAPIIVYQQPSARIMAYQQQAPTMAYQQPAHPMADQQPSLMMAHQ